ncbi:neuropeptide FF receptor 2-like [Aplysia californica]|uniref:Neuropeptide FF receptor 2-like n=1 Tax=Aplysia californica TaxID=6500 RepID=A0ABM0K4I2_APLCA|nr:neuropeptide FF receptor 2-like [Aplysia californica]
MSVQNTSGALTLTLIDNVTLCCLPRVMGGQRSGLISDAVSTIVTDLVLRVVVQFVLGVFCIGANIINMTVFIKIGLEDSITVAFFALAISDLMFVGFYLAVSVLAMLHNVFKLRQYVQFNSLGFLLVWYSYAFFDASVLITVFLAVQKCACVAIPLLFKKVFTKSRSVVVVVVIYVGTFTWYMPLLSQQGMRDRFDPRTNTTTLIYKFPPHIKLMLQLFKSVSRSVLPGVSLSLIIISVIVLTIKLKQASKFRKASASHGNKDNNKNSDASSTKQNSSSNKELRVIKAVTLVSTIFVVCYIPSIVVSCCQIIFPGLSDKGRYKNMRRLVDEINSVLTTVNSSVNIFIYFYFNTRYREQLVDLIAQFRRSTAR